MKFFKILFSFSVLMCSITNCASQKFEQEAPVGIKQIYTQHWNSGVEGGGSGINIFVDLQTELPKHITLDSIYFNTFQLPLKQDSHNVLLFAGRKVNAPNKKYTLPTNSVVTGNVVTKPTVQKPKFELTDNACVIRYSVSGKVKYFKYEDLYNKSTPPIPSTRPNP